jgi:anti-anti-sigma regulatory factor
MYHSAELCFLAAIYNNLESLEQPLELHFTPQPGAFGGVLRVAPDLLPPKSVKIMQVWVDGHEHPDFDAEALTVTLPHSKDPQTVRVRLVTTATVFSADTVDAVSDNVRIALAGSLGAQRLPVLQDQVQAALDGGCSTLVLDVQDLVYLDIEAVRYLAMLKQHHDIALSIAGAQAQVAQILRDSELDQELVAAGDLR